MFLYFYKKFKIVFIFCFLISSTNLNSDCIVDWYDFCGWGWFYGILWYDGSDLWEFEEILPDGVYGPPLIIIGKLGQCNKQCYFDVILSDNFSIGLTAVPFVRLFNATSGNQISTNELIDVNSDNHSINVSSLPDGFYTLFFTSLICNEVKSVLFLKSNNQIFFTNSKRGY